MASYTCTCIALLLKHSISHFQYCWFLTELCKIFFYEKQQQRKDTQKTQKTYRLLQTVQFLMTIMTYIELWACHLVCLHLSDHHNEWINLCVQVKMKSMFAIGFAFTALLSMFNTMWVHAAGLLLLLCVTQIQSDPRESFFFSFFSSVFL